MDHVKYLGVHITSDLRWDKHIDNICSRVNSSLGFILRNVNISNPRVKGLAHQSYVHPVLEYSPTVWDPYTTGSIKKTESVQRRMAWFTLGQYRHTSSVNAMLTHLNWEPLASKQHAASLLIFLQDSLWFGCNYSALRYQVASCFHASRKLSGLPHPTVIVWLSLFFFSPRTVCNWNILPEAVIRASSHEVFRVWFMNNPTCILVLHRQSV